LKKLSAILAVLAVVFAVSSSFAQPQVVVHVTGGYNLPMPDLKGTYPTDSNSYIQKSGFNAGADVKYYLGKKRNVGITLSLGYNGFTSGDVTTTFGTLTNKINSFTAGLGVEYSFMPKGKANPFIGAEFTGNFFSGKVTVTPTSGTATDITLKSASRFGVMFNGGVDIALSKSIGAVIGLRYNLANLIGKDSASSGSTTEYTLQDKAYTNAAGQSVNAKNISWLTIYAGLGFAFNKPKTMKK
jgi:opacity protein-like surface antigen